MIQQKSQYQRKIEELHSQIKEKAIELQKIQENVESEKKNRDELRENIHNLKNEVTKLELDKNMIKEEIKLRSDAKGKDISETETELKLLYSEIENLQKDKFQLQKDVDNLHEIYKKISNASETLDGLKNEINSIRNEKSQISNELKLFSEEKKKLEKEIENARGKSNKILESTSLVTKDIQEFYNAIGPWISAIASWHAKHGGEMPELLHDWKPKGLYVSQKVHKELKNKQK